MNKKRFLYVGAFQLPDKNAGAQRVVGIAKLLEHMNYIVEFIDIDSNINSNKPLNATSKLGFNTYSTKPSSNMLEWVNHALVPTLVEDVLALHDDWCGIIAYNYPGFALAALKKICKREKISLLADCTEWYSFNYRLLMATNVDSFVRMRIMHKQIDGLIVISNYLNDYYKSFLPTVIIPPLVDKNDEKWGKDANLKDVSSKIKLFYVGSPGKNMHKDKLNIIIETFNEIGLRDFSLNIVGISRDDYLAQFPKHREIVINLEEFGNINFYGRLSHLEALTLLKNADYSIFYREQSRMTVAGFPTKFVESISSGVPVITNLTSDLKKYLGAGNNGIIINDTDIKQELHDIFNKIIEAKEAIKVDKSLFDFRNYEEDMSAFLGKLHL